MGCFEINNYEMWLEPNDLIGESVFEYMYRFQGYQTGQGKIKGPYLIGKGGWSNYINVFSCR
jgi:hypothetical protein